MSANRPFDDLINLIKQLSSSEGMDDGVPSIVQMSSAGAEADVSDLVVWLKQHQKTSKPKLDESHICILVSSYCEQDEVGHLKSFIDNAGKGQEPVSKLCKERGVGLRVLEMAPEIPHVVSEEWPESQCMAAAGFGMEAAAAGGNILGLASLAPGNEQYCEHLCELVISLKKQNFNELNESDTFAYDVLTAMKNNSGREVAATVGAMIAAHSRGMPVLVEGWSSITALCILKSIAPGFTNHIRVASNENTNQAAIIEAIDERPIVGGYVNLGPGCGIALAHSLIALMLNL